MVVVFALSRAHSWWLPVGATFVMPLLNLWDADGLFWASATSTRPRLVTAASEVRRGVVDVRSIGAAFCA